MTPLSIAGAISVLVLSAGLLGLLLQRALPETFTTGGARDMIGAVSGLLTLLSALVLGLLIWTAYGVFSGQNLAIQTLAAKVLQLDIALAEYGPEAGPLRAQLKASVGKTISEFRAGDQSDAAFVGNNLEGALRNLEVRDRAVKTLQPQSDEQKRALANAGAIVNSVSQLRLQMALALSSPVSYPLVMTVAAWVSTIFLAFGLTAKGHMMNVIAVGVGALAAGSAFFLILDMSAPYEGLYQISTAPLQEVMSVMGREPAKD